jgi:hypothetical protein
MNYISHNQSFVVPNNLNHNKKLVSNLELSIELELMERYENTYHS